MFLLAGDPAAGSYIVDAREIARRSAENSLKGADTYFAGYPNAAEVSPIQCPDNLAIDPQGRLWIVTDTDNKNHPNNGCFVVPTSGPAARPAQSSSPAVPMVAKSAAANSRPTGARCSSSIQHPGEGGSIDNPRSHWPDGNGLARARAALSSPSNVRTASTESAPIKA